MQSVKESIKPRGISAEDVVARQTENTKAVYEIQQIASWIKASIYKALGALRNYLTRNQFIFPFPRSQRSEWKGFKIASKEGARTFLLGGAGKIS